MGAPSCRGLARAGDGDAGDLRRFRAVLAQGAVPGVVLLPQGRHEVRATAAAAAAARAAWMSGSFRILYIAVF